VPHNDQAIDHHMKVLSKAAHLNSAFDVAALKNNGSSNRTTIELFILLAYSTDCMNFCGNLSFYSP
jgi:hypothetical protein